MGASDLNEGYPVGWLHGYIHLNPKTGEIHTDEPSEGDGEGPHPIREWLLGRPPGDRFPADIKSHSGGKYVRQIRSCITHEIIGEVDVYCVLEAFGDPPAPIAHAIKKLLCAGVRDKGSRVQDLKEARDALTRAIQMEEGK